MPLINFFDYISVGMGMSDTDLHLKIQMLELNRVKHFPCIPKIIERNRAAEMTFHSSESSQRLQLYILTSKSEL